MVILLGLLMMVGCQEPPVVEAQSADGPKLIYADPEHGAKDIKGDNLTITLTFDQNIKCPPSQHSQITIDGNAANGNTEVGNAAIENVNAYMTTLTIKVAGLKSGSTYAVKIPSGIVQGYRENQKGCDEIIYSFSTKEQDVSHDYALEPVETLVNPNATQQAKNVYAFLREQSGKKTLSGAQSSHSNKNDFVDYIAQQTGRHPALAGYDFIFLHYSPTPDGWTWVQNYNDISAAKEQWNANGLVSYMWHWNVPATEKAWKEGDMDAYAFYSSNTNFDIKEALKPGTWQNDFIMQDIKEVAGYLQILEDENIPVIWRPLHEAAGNYDIYGGNGAWFWWGRGGAEPCKQLWRLLYDQLVGVYGLDNLIWVWTADVPVGAEDQWGEWYPGDEYVDIVGVDIYASDTEAKTRQYQALVDMTKGRKLVTVSECGNIPDPAKCMSEGNKWSWFMVWCTSDSDGNLALNNNDWTLNTLSHWRNVMGSAYVMNREDMPSLK